MPDRFRDRFESAFSEAHYTVEFEAGPATFRVGEGTPGVEPLGIVTACNPPAAPRTAAQNASANAELLAAITARGWRHYPSLASAPDGTHAEPGYAVFGATALELLDLAREFGQAAIAWFDGQQMEILWTDEDR